MKSVKLRGGMQTLSWMTTGEGPAMVLLHGFCGSSRYFERVIPELTARYRLIVPDLRGHGASPALPGPYRIEAMAEDVRLLLDALEIDQAVLYGHSLGGYITLAFAELYPERLRGFGLIHSTAYPDSDEAKENRLKAMATIREQGIRPYVDGLVPRLFAPAHVESMREAVETAAEIGYGTDPDGAIATLGAMRERPDRRHVLRDARVPVLLVAGEEDRIVPVANVHAVEGPHITAVRLAGCGHMGMFEVPRQLAHRLAEHAALCWNG
jgi:pimeloyl-ACP methyl ester carboxylesterase